MGLNQPQTIPTLGPSEKLSSIELALVPEKLGTAGDEGSVRTGVLGSRTVPPSGRRSV